MSKHHLKDSAKYKMYQPDAFIPFCSSARKPTHTLDSRMKGWQSGIRSFQKTRNLVNATTSASHLAEFKTSIKRVVSQGSARHKKLKLKNPTRIPVKRSKFNIHTIKSKEPSSTKQQEISLGERFAIAPHPPNRRPNIQISPANNYEYDNLIRLLECTRVKLNKSRPITPCGQFAKVRRNNVLEVVQNKSIRRNMCKGTSAKKHEASYELLDNKTNNNKFLNSVKFNMKEYDDPYKLISESKQTMFMNSEDSKRLWKKHVNDDNCSTATDKLSSLIGRSIPNEEVSDSDDNLTVIENDCDNDYSLIYRCLQNKKL
eukprot:TRINITY_DN5040_c0_g2_i2.p1 TRINITY_DN5040_c0_g2~~TRINITY_DN5040_c0_g2_i2.p1  ORF type:complete len:315 (-),score=81.41 TRINITY_DN5040_c0_g2_i2:179-1123(-)